MNRPFVRVVMVKLSVPLMLGIVLSGCELFDVKLTNTPDAGTRSADSGGAGATADTSGDSQQQNILSGIKVPIMMAPASGQEEVLQIMRYSRIMHNYPKAKLKQEFKQVANDLHGDPSNAKKIQLAILLSIPKTSFQNEKRAIQLLTNIVNDVKQSSSGLQEYAYLMLESIQQRHEIEQQVNKIARELEKEKQKRQQLEEQLNALKSIEKSISQRQLNSNSESQ